MIGGRELARRAAPILLMAGVLLLAYVGFVLADARAHQSVVQPGDSTAAGNPVAEAGVAPVPLVDGEPLGQIVIERIGLSAVIAQGESTIVLRRGVGHLADTAWLGQPGNVVLAGHRDTFFRPLRKIRPGDLIEVTTPDRRARYEVESTTVVSPTSLAVLESSSGNTLTLITCFPFNFVGSAPNRFIVRAREVNAER